MSRGLLATIALSAAVQLGAAAPGGPPAGKPVLLHVGIDRADGTPVTGLTGDDFEVLIDGLPRAIDSFSTADESLSLVLLLDVTTSMHMGDLTSGLVLRRALDEWFPLSLKPRDRARVGLIARTVALTPRFTADRRELMEDANMARTPTAIEKLGPSPIWDAVDAAVSALEWEAGHRAVLVFTDGRATGNRLGMRDVATHASSIGVSVHVIAERDEATPISQIDGTTANVTPSVNLRVLAQITGGAYMSDKPFPWSDPGPLIGRVLNGLHHVYTLGLDDGGDGRTHTVEVRLKTPDFRVRVRKTFVSSYQK